MYRTLRAEAIGRNGKVIAPAGTQLTEKHLRRFKTWGVIELDVDDAGSAGRAGDSSGPKKPIDKSAVIGELRRRFRHNRPHHPLIKALARHCIRKAGSAS